MCAFDQVDRHVNAFYERIAPRLSEGVLPPVDVALELGPFRLSGRIDRRTSAGLIHYRPGRIRARDRLELWIQHLMAHLSPEGPPAASLILGLQTTLQYGRVPDPDSVLGGLLDLYWQGLTTPLPFFPESSLAFAAAILQQGKTDRDGLKSARTEWAPNATLGLPREGEDPHMELCFRNRDPFAFPFQETALAVFGRLLSHEQKLD
jgi:exodeoxyribonuclease V gamma subunit